MSGDLCRVTVVGPDRKVDLAVPSRTTVATLLPLLVRHTTDTGRYAGADVPEGAWVLQRLGGEVFELSGTPESLDWLSGEQLYLRPAEDPLPELDFDDLAEGVATVVNRRSDRWKPEYRRKLFLVLSIVAMAAIAWVLTDVGPAPLQVAGAGAISVVLFAFAMLFARVLRDGGVALLFGLGSAGFAALAAASAFDGDPEGIAVNQASSTAAAIAVAAVSGVLVLVQRTLARDLPAGPVMMALTAAGVLCGVLALQTGMGMTTQRAAAVGATVVFVLIVLAPKLAVKFARLRGPQLPKTGEEMTFDIEPSPSDVVRDRTSDADVYLTVVMMVSGVVLPVLFYFVRQVPDWSGWSLVLALASALLLRARTFLGLWQRIGLVTAGTVGCLMVITHLSATLPPGWRLTLLGGLIALLIPLVAAALRPWPRRLLPFWEYSATVLDVTAGLAVLPVLAQVLGGYAWARGLFG
jgi:type VII secretion integral membrane protein EccD